MRAYRDGIQDLASRLKSKMMEYLDYFRGNPSAKPLAKSMISAIRICSSLNSPIDGEDFQKNIKRLYTTRKDIAILFKPNRLLGDNEENPKARIAWLSAGRKIVLGSMEAMVGYASDEAIASRVQF